MIFFSTPLLCFTFRACSAVLWRHWCWDFALFVRWFGHFPFFKTVFVTDVCSPFPFFFFLFLSVSFFLSFPLLPYFPPHFLFLHLSPQSRGVCCSLFVVWAIIQNAGLFSFWQAPEQGNEKWLTQFSSSSFSLALLLSNTCTPHIHTHTHTHTHTFTDTHMRAHTCTPPTPTNPSDSSRAHFHRWLVKSPQKKDTQICKVVRGFLSTSTVRDIQYVRSTLTPRRAMAPAHH